MASYLVYAFLLYHLNTMSFLLLIYGRDDFESSEINDSVESETTEDAKPKETVDDIVFDCSYEKELSSRNECFEEKKLENYE